MVSAVPLFFTLTEKVKPTSLHGLSVCHYWHLTSHLTAYLPWAQAVQQTLSALISTEVAFYLPPASDHKTVGSAADVSSQDGDSENDQ